MKLVISMFTPGMAFDGDALDKQSLGGSETAALCLARELAAQGHQVYHFCNCPNPGEYDNVTYLPLDRYSSFVISIPHDVTIVERMPQLLSGKCSAKLKYLWCHDLAHGRAAPEFNGATWNIDKVVVVSEWMKKQYMDVYGLDEQQLIVMRNGIDLERIVYSGLSERNRKRLIYTSRPERGLDVLLSKIFPKVLERVPDATLAIGGYNNQVEHLREFYQHIADLMKPFGDKIEWLGHMSKSDLYDAYGKSGVYTYPTPSTSVNQSFYEVSCITALECMASGLPFVATDRGALSETCGKDNCLIGGHPSEEGYADQFVDEICRLMTDDEYFLDKTLSAKSHLEETRYDWKQVAVDWKDEFLDRFSQVNDDPGRLVRHFFDTSDIIAAQYILDNHAGSYPNLQQKLDEHWGFYKDSVLYKKQYDKVGSTHTDIYESSAQEPRLQYIKEWLVNHPEIKTMLDLGCGLGVYSIEISNAFPDIKITGIDISDRSIEMAKEYVERYAKHPQNLEFIVGDQDNIQIRRDYDCVLAAEVVEHVSRPWEFIQRAENAIKSGGWVLLTVPYGPWEQMSYDSYPHRCHLWNFEYHDLLDMLGKKPKLNIQSVFCGINDQLAEPLGHNFICYRADHRPIGGIDLERKITVQNPHQTLSVNIICGPGAEETLHWCLRSILPIANEIVIGNSGMSDAAKSIIEQYVTSYRLENIIIIDIPSPLETGFDDARNAILAQSSMDWILWIDTDEKLLEPSRLFKYLQTNGYSGYGIRQHHFAVDTSFTPDMPVRLFRRDAGLSFFGRVHEHPEKELNAGPGKVIVVSDVHIAHVGYLIESGRRGRFWRNSPLLKRDIESYPNRLLQKHFIIRDNMLMCSYILQQNGGRVTDEIIGLARETVDLYNEHFLGKMGYVNVDSKQYVSQALKILGEGFDCSYSFTASKDGVTESFTEQDTRYASYDDLIKDVTWQLESSVKRFDREYF